MSEKKTQTIIIVDDGLEDREILRQCLLQDRESSYTILEEETGEKTLELCKAAKPDCILLDYNLPDMNGLELLTELTDASGSVRFPVVILTDVTNESIAVKAMQQGAQDYLVKDKISTESIHRAIRNAIERVDMLRTLEAQRHDLEQKNQEMQAFAYALAHDLRAPLRAISSFAQIVYDDYRTALDKDGQHYVENIVKSCKQMDRLIDDLLGYTRIEHRAVRLQPVALQPMVEQIISSLSERIAATSATVTIPENLPVVQGDRTLLSQILINLLDNALTYSRPGIAPHITVSCLSGETYYLLRVTDNGISIPAEHFEQIFTIFQRLHGEEEYPGTGIGLAIVKKSVELMNGEVWVESVAGEGSTFCVKLPA